MAEQLFSLMSKGGVSIVGSIPHFNGEVFSDNEAPDLTKKEITYLLRASSQDWTAVDPSIFGTLFERVIDPNKRAQIGAHYTPPSDILDVIEPVIFEPLFKEWEDLRSELEPLTKTFFKEGEDVGKQANLYDTPLGSSAKVEAVEKLDKFLDRLSNVKVLDPACGSGNFLYMTMQRLMDLEFSVRSTLRLLDPGKNVPTRIHPKQFYGFEINRYAHEIAGMVLWIGYLQWLRSHDEMINQEPILQKLENLQNVDAVLDGDKPKDWPDVDYIVGNPPFLGSYKIRKEFGNEYTNNLHSAYDDKLPNDVDLVCYWFEKAREQLKQGKVRRSGLIATNSIRGGSNQTVLRRIKETGEIFSAWADRPWFQDGAAVRVSIVGFDDGSESEKILYGYTNEDTKEKFVNTVVAINADLTSGVNLVDAKALNINRGKAFEGVKPAGPFDIVEEVAKAWLDIPNPTDVSNAQVLKPYIGGMDITGKPSKRWVIDFNQMSYEAAEKYQLPFAHVEKHVKPVRSENRRERRREIWWQFGEAYPRMRQAINLLKRFIATSAVSKHRFFVWIDANVLPANSLITFAFEDDFTYGVLNSNAHEIWALKMGTSLEDRPRYTPSTCFETFPFPNPSDAQKEPISQAAKYLHTLREHLKAKGQTLTEIYNELEDLRAQPKPSTTHPVYPLLLAHETLDKTVYASYGWEYPLSDEVILERLLALNSERAASQEQ